MILPLPVKEALEEQVQLLSERSKQKDISPNELSELSKAMAEISHVLAV